MTVLLDVTMPLKIVICTKYRLFREGLKALFPEGDTIAVVGEAVTAKEALALLKDTTPDVVLMDPVASDLSGARVIHLITTSYPHVRVLLVSMSADTSLISQWIRAGASGYIDNHAKPAQLKATINSICEASAKKIQNAGLPGS
jgi:DNA-binding NarL/FixJ family response regulator